MGQFFASVRWWSGREGSARPCQAAGIHSDGCKGQLAYTVARMDVERIIDDIEQLQEMFEAPDIRPLSTSDISAANRRHDEMLAHSPWFRLWQHYGVCCRPEA
jgi:hypothetical protein